MLGPVQASMPFDQEELEYVERLDPQQDVELLRRELPALREESLRTLEVSSTLLKLACSAGLTLAEIATIISRPLVGMDEEASELEKLCQQTRQEVCCCFVSRFCPPPLPPPPQHSILE